MTSAEYRALNAPKKAIAAPPRNAAPSPKGKTQPAAAGERTEPEIPKPEIPVSPSIAATHYIGRYQLNVANGTHYPGRARYVVTGPASEELTDTLVAAITQFTSNP